MWSKSCAISSNQTGFNQTWHGACEASGAEQKALAMIAQTAAIAPSGEKSEVLAALRTASAKTGSDFDYLLATAKRESSLDSTAKSKTSSATGLFQFIDQTWLGLVKRHGEKHGLGTYAGAIETNSKGRFTVASPDTKAAILALRQNPTLSALMAGEAVNCTKQSLETQLGRDVCAGELYAAHFLGEGGACQLIRAYEKDPNAPADAAFPQAAKANRSVFYKADGTAKTVGEVYAWAVGPDAKNSGAAKAHSVAPATASASRHVAPEKFLAGDRIASFAPRRAAIAEMVRDEQEFGRLYIPSAPLASRAPMAALNALPNKPLLLNAGVLEIFSMLAPAGLRRTAG